MGLNERGIASCERLTEEQICNEKFFREFSTYLTAHAVKSNGDLLMSGTATQYLFAIKDMAMKKFAEKKIWEERILDRWYPSLRVAVGRLSIEGRYKMDYQYLNVRCLLVAIYFFPSVKCF
jgi:hypothetical protein